MAGRKIPIAFDSRVDVTEEIELAFQYFERMAVDEGYDMTSLMHGMLIAISCLVEDEGHPVQ